MSDRKFKIGDVVVLRSGGPQMTVLQYEVDKFNYVEDDEEPGVECCWFAETGNGYTPDDIHSDEFAEEILTLLYTAEAFDNANKHKRDQ